jgi:hypothetical protein
MDDGAEVMTEAARAPSEMTLVDADEAAPADAHELMTPVGALALERIRGDEAGAHPVVDIANLKLAPANLNRAHEVRRAFDRADEDCAVGEGLLRELVAGETAVALELQDVEAAVVVLLRNAITDPAMAAAVSKTLRDVVAVSTSVRKRMENSLGAAENLKAQRRFLSAQRGRIGV